MSTPHPDLSEESLVEILKEAQTYNIAHEISGFLVSTHDQLIQLIEGKEDDVRELFEIIRKDRRHHHIQIENEVHTGCRSIPFFGMGLCFTYLVENLDHHFYFTKEEAQQLNGLIDGKIGKLFQEYLV